MIKQMQLFLLEDDELVFTSSLRAARPGIVFVDGARWETRNPVLSDSIASCASWWVFLWDQGIVPRLPVGERRDGQFEGPTAGLVLELTRSKLNDKLLLSGRLAVSTGVSDKRTSQAMNEFAADVWRVMKSITQAVVCVDPTSGKILREKVGQYRAGHRATAWAQGASEHFFRDRSVQVFFRPETSSHRDL